MEWWAWLTTIFGGILLIKNVITAICDIFKPALKLEERVSELERHEKNDMRRYQQYDDLFEKQETTNQALLTGMADVINHELDGNGIDKLKITRDELYNHIIKR